MMVSTAMKYGSAALMALVVYLAKGETKPSASCHDGVPASATAALEPIKRLAGTWVEADQNGKPTDKVVSQIRVISGGSAVEEMLFLGSDHEMVTIYHMDGSDLVLTHYCALGNQPRMRAEKGADPNKIVFKCVGGTNMKSEDDSHMHEAEITLVDANRFRAEWRLFEKGKNVHTANFDVVRR